MPPNLIRSDDNPYRTEDRQIFPHACQVHNLLHTLHVQVEHVSRRWRGIGLLDGSRERESKRCIRGGLACGSMLQIIIIIIWL